MLDRALATAGQDTGMHQQSRADLRKLQLDMLSPITCEALSGIYRLGQLAKLRLGPRAIGISPRWQAQPPRIADPCTIGLRIDEDMGELIIPEKLVDRILADLEPGLRLAALSEEIRPILIEYVLRDALEILERASGCRITVEAVRQGRSLGADGKLVTAHFLADVQDLGQSSCLLRLAPGQLAALASYLRPLAEPAVPRVDVPLPVRLRWGRVDLTLAELRSLRPGDVVLLDHACPQPGIALAVIGEHLAAPVELTRTGYRFASQPSRATGSGHDWAIDRESVTASSLGDANGLEGVHFAVFLEFGRFELGRSLLAQLRTASELPLVRPLEAGLDIVAGRATIGRGEVTVIGGAIGIRITRI
jgi:type III secretion protein Q